MKYLRLSLLFVLAALLVAVLSPSPAARADSQDVVEGFGIADLSGGYLYVEVSISVTSEPHRLLGTELRVYDVSDPMSPVEVGSRFWRDSHVDRLFVGGGFAYLEIIGQGERYLQIVDASDRFKLPETGKITPLRGHFTVRGRYLYVKDFTDETLSIYRVDDTGHPHLVSSTPFPPSESSSIGSLAVEESMQESGMVLDWPYLYRFRSGVRVDVSDPANPVPAGRYSYPGSQFETWSVKDGAYYTADYVPHETDEYSLVIADVSGGWKRTFPGGPIDPDASISDFEMVWGKHLLVSALDSFIVYDLADFSTKTGSGDVSIVYEELIEPGEPTFGDISYDYYHDVLYLSRGVDGLKIIQAPFPTPTLDNEAFLPIGLQ